MRFKNEMLIEWKKEKKLKNEECAEYAGISLGAWISYVKGKSVPTVETINLFASRIGINPIDFLEP